MKKIIAFLIFACLTAFTYIDGLNIMLDSTEVYFIDVDQGDASLILTGDEAILIDGGTNAHEDEIVAFIQDKGVSSIDLVIATHPHEDHIGGLDAVLQNFEVDEILMADLPHNTKTYEDVVTAATENQVSIIYPDDKDYFEFNSGLILSLLTPSKSFESNDTNNDSIVCRVDIGETSILYTGDMEKQLEKELLPKIKPVDILKTGHHGSDSSSTAEFLDKASPETAIISCGLDNKYGHPHKEVVDRLNERNIEIRRTDVEGHILYNID